MNYIQYTFTVSPPEPGSDILIALLADMGFESFSASDTGFEAYVQEECDNEAEIRLLQFDDFTVSYTRNLIPKTNWNEEWEKNFTPVYVDDLVCIRANFHTKSETAKYDIVITPKMSFGTGHHDTTWLMSKTMFTIDLKNKSVLDMGCGTGILAILARQMGASPVLGIDIDDWSIENSVENAEVNNTADISFRKGDASLLTATPTFDVILANINKNVLKKDMPVYYAALKQKGVLLLSGFFMADVEELRQVAHDAGFGFEASFNRHEWAVIKLSKQ